MHVSTTTNLLDFTKIFLKKYGRCTNYTFSAILAFVLGILSFSCKAVVKSKSDSFNCCRSACIQREELNSGRFNTHSPVSITCKYYCYKYQGSCQIELRL